VASVTLVESTLAEQPHRCDPSLVGVTSGSLRCAPGLYQYTYTLRDADGKTLSSATRQVPIATSNECAQRTIPSTLFFEVCSF
jgi:hypothetical protein